MSPIPKTVLVVEDERDIRESLREILEEEGFQVLIAANGKEAIEQVPALPRPCAIVLDIIMPVMSGTEFYAALRAEPSFADIPVLVSTSDPSRAPNGVRLLNKPIKIDRLINEVNQLFERSDSAL